MKRKLVILATAMMILTLAAPAWAETISYFLPSGQITGPGSFFFDITPFDTTQDTLNSVTISAELNISGSAQMWTPNELATLTVSFVNTLDPVSELGWNAPLVLNYSDFTGTQYFDDFDGVWVASLAGSANLYAGPNTITSGFGRFAGVNPFQIGFSLTDTVSSDGGETDILAFSYDGNATLTIDYDYTPGASAAVPEPATVLLFGFGLVGLAGLRRFKK